MERRTQGRATSSVLSGIAFVLSTWALLLSGYTVHQVLAMRQTLNTTRNSEDRSAIALNPSTSQQTPSPVAKSDSPARIEPPLEISASQKPETTTSALNNQEIQPGQFVQPAYQNKARVELLSVKRIQNPETGKRDFVDVRVRIRRLATQELSALDTIYMGRTTAGNSETGETYGSDRDANPSTGSVALFLMSPNSSTDAYVQLHVPQGVNAIDLHIPETEPFKNVPIGS